MSVLANAVLLLTWYAGHCELWTAALNRVYANPWSRRRLSRWRLWHDGALLLFPPLLIGWVGLYSPGVLVGGRWNELGIAWSGYAILCGCGIVSLVLHSLWQGLRPRPRWITRRDSRVIDLASQLGGRPIGAGRHQGMARLPLNQTFQLDIVSRTVKLPGLPPAWNGLTIVQLTDLHFTGTVDRRWFDAVIDLVNETRPDLAVCTGDLIDEMSLIDWLPKTLGRINAPLGRFFILGNHDQYQRPDEIRQVMVEQAGWRDLAGRCEPIEHAGQVLEIGGTERPWMGQHPSFDPAAAPALKLLLSHTPDNVTWAQQQHIDIVLAGHNHGGQVCLPLIGPVYSPSRFGCRFAAGEFQLDPTLMIVSRGLSGRHPLRLFCRPELTRIVLETATQGDPADAASGR